MACWMGNEPLEILKDRGQKAEFTWFLEHLIHCKEAGDLHNVLSDDSHQF